MFKRKRTRGAPFNPGFDENRNNTGRGTVALEFQPVYKRHEKSMIELVKSNKHLCLEQLEGVKLRPKNESAWDDYEAVHDNSNDVVDLEKLRAAHNAAHKAHRQYALLHKCTKHVPCLQLKKRRNQGFGVTIVYHCSQCAFVSDPFKLYDCDSSGSCITNVQAGIAFSKSTIKPTDAHFLFSSLNINGPSQVTLQKHFSRANVVCSDLLESSLAENRGVVRDYVAIVEGGAMEQVPAVAVAFDGQYDRPLYHGYDGQSSSVSEPVIEAETGLNLLVSHAVTSKLDGTYDKNKVNMEFRSVAVCCVWLHLLLIVPYFFILQYLRSTSMVQSLLQ